jgi:hypothetical protein
METSSFNKKPLTERKKIIRVHSLTRTTTAGSTVGGGTTAAAAQLSRRQMVRTTV